ncbi:hypothetical protein [Streptomyces sp. CNQ-509]|uniref:hypothetical protein n=1 Tax=Streptomyces sp. CNQ-509 TaxID=444103 RepID=UPI0013DDFED3|nr:hypothetical protein [Streptomyces sp. CNQ-509]
MKRREFVTSSIRRRTALAVSVGSIALGSIALALGAAPNAAAQPDLPTADPVPVNWSAPAGVSPEVSGTEAVSTFRRPVPRMAEVSGTEAVSTFRRPVPRIV